jgi:hypothetical protein
LRHAHTINSLRRLAITANEFLGLTVQTADSLDHAALTFRVSRYAMVHGRRPVRDAHALPDMEERFGHALPAAS